jgi:hypothetical protein
MTAYIMKPPAVKRSFRIPVLAVTIVAALSFGWLLSNSTNGVGASFAAALEHGATGRQVLMALRRSSQAIKAECAAYAVPPPLPLPEEKLALGREAVALIRGKGVLAAMGANETIAAFLRGCTLEERERIGYEAHSTALYLVRLCGGTHGRNYPRRQACSTGVAAHGMRPPHACSQGEEVVTVQSAEEEAVLAAAPLRDLAALNGINIGAGGRPVHPTLLMVDAHRGFGSEGAALPSAQKAPLSTIMAWADDLPFKQGAGVSNQSMGDHACGSTWRLGEAESVCGIRACSSGACIRSCRHSGQHGVAKRCCEAHYAPAPFLGAPS